MRWPPGLRTSNTVITADAGYHSEENLRGLCERAVPAMIADGLMRKRDPQFADQARHKAKPDPLYDKSAKKAIVKFLPKDFIFDPVAGSYVCPAGKRLYSTGSACVTNRRKHHKFRGAKRDCGLCDCERAAYGTPNARRRTKWPSSRGIPTPRPGGRRDRYLPFGREEANLFFNVVANATSAAAWS